MAKVELRINEMLEDRGKSAYWLAKELEMNHGNLYSYRKNRVKAINLELLARMCELLECDIADLMQLVDEKSESKKKKAKS
ncbi:MAG: helix-turn-helix transcriptional regulator [Blastocatellia bacterium]